MITAIEDLDAIGERIAEHASTVEEIGLELAALAAQLAGVEKRLREADSLATVVRRPNH